jgi:hypothetical protein
MVNVHRQRLVVRTGQLDGDAQRIGLSGDAEEDEHLLADLGHRLAPGMVFPRLWHAEGVGP